MTEQPVFYYDLGSPYAYLAAERIHKVLPVVPVWQPILLGGIWQETGGGSWAMTEARAEGIAEVERRATERGLLPASGLAMPGRCRFEGLAGLFSLAEGTEDAAEVHPGEGGEADIADGFRLVDRSLEGGRSGLVVTGLALRSPER